MELVGVNGGQRRLSPGEFSGELKGQLELFVMQKGERF
jgi:hypothetical protein